MLDRRFLLKFGTFFDADDIDLRDLEELRERAGDLAASVYHSPIDRAELTAQLQDFMRSGAKEAMVELTDHGYVDWNRNDETRAALKTVLETFLSELN